MVRLGSVRPRLAAHAESGSSSCDHVAPVAVSPLIDSVTRWVAREKLVVRGSSEAHKAKFMMKSSTT